jgi:TolA-binding protein
MKCTLCNERNGNTRCEGCNTLFCLVCMTKHHDELIQQFQLLMNVRNEVKESMETKESTSPNGKRITCLDEIDRWEATIIQCIQQIAAKARTNVNEILTGHMTEIRHRFEELSLDMLQQQKEGNYLENDINRVKNQLDQLKNDIEHVSENIQVDTALSNNIEWETLIYVAETDLSTSKSIRVDNRVAKQKQASGDFSSFAPSWSSRIEQAESSKYIYYINWYSNAYRLYLRTIRI